MRRLSLVAGCAALCVALPHAQQSTPFRSSVDVVPVFATVLNPDKSFRSDLNKDDFTLLDNGKVQPITSFSAEAQAISVSVILDTSSSMAQASRRTFRAASIFLDDLRPDDRAMVGSLIYQGPPFTSDKDRLRTSLNLLPPDGGSPIYAAIDRAVTLLKSESNRPVIVIYTDGKDVPLFHRFTSNGPVPDPAQTEEHLRARVEAEGVMIYAIGFEGVPLTGAMKTLARQSGGRATEMKRSDDLAAALAAVADELHHQYLLGFAPAALDGRVHTLDVRARPKGLTIRARQSYVAK